MNVKFAKLTEISLPGVFEVNEYAVENTKFQPSDPTRSCTFENQWEIFEST